MRQRLSASQPVRPSLEPARRVEGEGTGTIREDKEEHEEDAVGAQDEEDKNEENAGTDQEEDQAHYRSLGQSGIICLRIHTTATVS